MFTNYETLGNVVYVQFPIFKTIFLIYELIHGFIILNLLEIRKFNPDIKDKGRPLLTYLFSFDCSILVWDGLNNVSGGMDNYGEEIYPM